MNGLVELVFEGVSDATANSLVGALLQGKLVTEISHSELGNLDPRDVCGDYLRFLCSTAEPVTMFVKTTEALLGGVKIHRPLIRILRYHAVNEVAIDFDSADIDAIDRRSAVLAMAAAAKNLAQSSKASTFYCGFEPASDPKTRLFSQEAIGPLTTI